MKARKLAHSFLAFWFFFQSMVGWTQSITNPILAGFYPDPSICKAGDDYYLVVSSFAYFPGLPIFHSTDLVNWKQIGAVLDRPEQLPLEGAGVSRGLFAPSISYHKGKFYLVCTLVDKGGNFVVTTDDPKKGNWSNPVWLPEVNGIDPSLFFDEDGKSYIVYNSIPPDNISAYSGHRTIRINEFDAKSLRVISNNRILVNGGTDLSKKPVWIEAPHIIKKDGWYYLICAEGGTAYQHSEVVFRTDSLSEPFVPFEGNPILTQRHLDPTRSFPVTTTGHADFTIGPDGSWWAVFLGCRPYEKNYFNAGRETFMAPVVWRAGWPIIELGGSTVKYQYPIQGIKKSTGEEFSGNFLFRADFNQSQLNHRFVFLRTPTQKWYDLRDGKLNMSLLPITCREPKNPAFVGFRQSHLKGYAATSVQFSPNRENEKAGLLVFQNESHYYLLAKSFSSGKPVVQLLQSSGSEADASNKLLAQADLPTHSSLQLKVEANGDAYSFYYAVEEKPWVLLLDKVDARFLSTEVAKGFVGVLYAMYATSEGKASQQSASFDWFESKNDDEVYKQLTDTPAAYLNYPMWNPNLSIEVRVNDLVKRLTREEKVAQMLNAAPAVPRLGIPAYDWWNEVLHGVARTPYKVTSYPQAIGMAATWDSSSLKRMAHYSATEGRAVYNKSMELKKNGGRYLGLTYWTPNINIFRDPRWGRGQETYGEDPFLTAHMGSAFVRGLQGDNPKYMHAAACAKHFAVHSGPEPSRHSDNFNPSVYDLWDTYLPAFQTLIVDAKVAGVMCAYNAVNTQPCCANDLLMNRILREKWKFKGYVTSDCWAIDDFFRYHKTHPDATASAVDAVLHGTDLECGQTVYKTLVNAMDQQLIKEAQIDVSLRRLFTVRYQLGLFDPVSQVPYAQTPFQVLEQESHQQHALKMAQQSIVLMRNERQTLPLKKGLKKIAVIGPNAQNPIAVLGNYNGTPSKVVTILDGIKNKLGKETEVYYEQAIQFTHDTLLIHYDISSRFRVDGQAGVRVDYYDNEKLTGNPIFSAIEKKIDHYWQEGIPPFVGGPSTHYAARYTTQLTLEEDQWISFEAEANDGFYVKINDSTVVNAWDKNRWGSKQFSWHFKKGVNYQIEMAFHQGEGEAMVRFVAGEYRKTDFAALSRRLQDFDAIVFVGGISPQLEGEEMPVKVPGFDGGDRTTIALPAVQTQLLQTLNQLGKPIVFVMLTGSAIAIPWEAEHIPAILNAWYGGQSAGTAVADVLFGDYNPAGRLPVTFYRTDADLPRFGDYSMKGRTYRYFNGKPLFPFGHGLSYSTFQYSQLSVPKSLQRNKDLKVQVKLTNTSNRAGEEVVQLYVSHVSAPGKAPIRSLRGFKRVSLKAGESMLVDFVLKPTDLSLVSEQDGALYQPKGNLEISVGGGQPNVDLPRTSNVVSKMVSVF